MIRIIDLDERKMMLEKALNELLHLKVACVLFAFRQDKCL